MVFRKEWAVNYKKHRKVFERMEMNQIIKGQKNQDEKNEVNHNETNKMNQNEKEEMKEFQIEIEKFQIKMEKFQTEKEELQIEMERFQTEKEELQIKMEELQIQNKELQAEQKKYTEQFLTAVRHLAAGQQEIAKLTGRLEQQEEYTRKILQILTTSEKEFIERIELVEYQNRIRSENLIYEWKAEELPEWFFYPLIRSKEDTIADIVKNRKSLARFGDGEFSIMFGRERAAFQQGDPKLRQRLLEVIQEKNALLMIGIANHYGSLKEFTNKAADDIRAYMTEEVRREHLSVLDSRRVYEDAYITRPYALYRDNQTENPGKRFAALQTIWENREVVFVEGEKTRMGVGNKLFSNVKSRRRVICPAEHAFSRYEEVLDYLLTLSNLKETLYLLALGPMATVLAFDLAKEGVQAIDIGHLDLEYEWYQAGKGTPVEVAYKYNNEFPGGRKVVDIFDPQYKQEILRQFL